MHVLVIGSGLAGLFAAVRATDAGHAVTLVTKRALADANTTHAQGGIAAALFPDDSTDSHLLDTLRAGDGLCDVDAARILVDEGPARVRDLIRFGVAFDRGDSGLARGLEAAHTRARVVHAGGDATGAAIEAALIAAVRERALAIHEHTVLADLVVEDGTVVGADLLMASARFEVRADAVLLATGGAGQLFSHTTNPSVATADGLAAAWRAGARLADLEFYQFHPTALAAPGTPLISEAVRGAGAVLRNDRGERFMITHHELAELAPRDVVARAIAREMAAQGGRPVLLDATHVPDLATRFPTITAATLAAGFDWTREPVPVSPAAHYFMGGVATDVWGRTTLPGLYAIGEVACTGVHGANRLASNSLLEAAVFADRAVRDLGTGDAPRAPEHAWPPRPVEDGRDAAEASALGVREAVQTTMWELVGVERSGEGLREAQRRLAALERPAATDAASVETANLLDTARLMTASALARQESRGAHFRTDFPLANPELAHRTPVREDVYA